MTRPAHGCGVPTLRGLLPRGTPCVTVSDGPATRRSQKTGTTSGLLRAPKVGALAFLDAAGVRLADTETIDALRRGAPATRFGAAWRCCFHARLSHKPRRPRFLVEIEQTPPGGPSEISPVKPSKAVRSRTRRWSRTRPHVIVSVVQRPSFMRQPRAKAVARPTRV